MNCIWKHPKSGAKLWQGDYVDATDWHRLAQANVGLVILAAVEHQPKLPDAFAVARLRLEDDPGMSEAQTLRTWKVARKGADLTAKYLKNGVDVLSSCWMGVNRSGLVSALFLVRHAGHDAEMAIRTVRENRTNSYMRQQGFTALCNPLFVEIVRREFHRQKKVSGR